MNTKKTILAILVGVAAGAILGALFAPDKGSGTRSRILTKAGKLSDALGGDIDSKLNRLRKTVIRNAKNEEESNNQFYDD